MKKIIYAIVALIILHLTFNIENCDAQWVQMSDGMGINKVVYSLTTLGNNMFAGTNASGVYLSTNNGSTWTQTALNN